MALEGGEGSASQPGRILPPGKIRYPSYKKLGGPQGRFGQVRNMSPPPEFDPRTVQPVASHYIACSARHTSLKDDASKTRIYTITSWICLISSHSREADENCTILRHYAASRNNFIPKFWDNLFVPFLRVILKMGPVSCPETSVRNCHYSLRNDVEECSSQAMSIFLSFHSWLHWELFSWWIFNESLDGMIKRLLLSYEMSSFHRYPKMLPYFPY
jgi:hypothetical protein